VILTSPSGGLTLVTGPPAWTRFAQPRALLASLTRRTRLWCEAGQSRAWAGPTDASPMGAPVHHGRGGARQPLVIGNRVLAATENDTVYALSANDGHVMWSVSLGRPTAGDAPSFRCSLRAPRKHTARRYRCFVGYKDPMPRFVGYKDPMPQRASQRRSTRGGY